MHHREYVSMIRQEIESLAHPHGVVYQEVYDEEEPIADVVLRDGYREFWVTVYWESDDLSVAMITLEIGKWDHHFNPYDEHPDFVAASFRDFRSLLRGESSVVEVHSGSTWMVSSLVSQLTDAELVEQAPSWNPCMTDKITHLNVVRFGYPTRVITVDDQEAPPPKHDSQVSTGSSQ
jgi:hypothetical protein